MSCTKWVERFLYFVKNDLWIRPQTTELHIWKAFVSWIRILQRKLQSHHRKSLELIPNWVHYAPRLFPFTEDEHKLHKITRAVILLIWSKSNSYSKPNRCFFITAIFHQFWISQLYNLLLNLFIPSFTCWPLLAGISAYTTTTHATTHIIGGPFFPHI